MRSRSAVSTIFFINGVVLASWGPHIPAVKAVHGLSDGQLGMVAAGFAAFSLAMAGGRFTGDRLVFRCGPARVLRVSSTIAALGLTLALLAGDPMAGVIGCGMVGLGISNVIPILFTRPDAPLASRPARASLPSRPPGTSASSPARR